MSETLSLKKTSSNNPTTGSETVTAASKLPWGFVLRLYSPQEEYEAVQGGGQRKVTKWYQKPGAPEFILNGNSYVKFIGDNGKKIESGYAITPGIPKAFWDEWYDQNKEGQYIKNGMIFAHTEYASIVSQAKDNESIKSGFERLDRNNLPRVGKHKIENADLKNA